MRKFFTFCLGVMLVSTLSAQKPEGVIMKASVAPEIDGVVDDVWAEANVYNIDKPFKAELPTLGESGETTWKALWTEDGFYLLVKVTDNSYWPSFLAGGNSYERDKPEVYFDVNYILEDGLGGHSNGNSGHYQFAPEMKANNISGEVTIDATQDGFTYAFMVDAPNYLAEYFFPFSYFVTNEGGPIDLTGQVGFDVTICESDEGDAVSPRKRAVWANVGAKDESWNNMDDAGIITFDGAEPPVFVEKINLTVDGAITVDNQTLQVGLEVLPEDAAVKTVKWVLTNKNGGVVRATISKEGVITPVLDEELIVQAISSDGFVYSNEVEVSITGQILAMEDANIVKNGNMDMVTETGAPSIWGNWVDTELAYGTTPTVVDGVAVLDCQLASADNWHYQFNQQNLAGIPNIPYVFKFKAWGSVGRKITVDFEDTSGNNYNRYGISSDAESNGRSEWTFDITTDPQWFTFHVTFDQIIPTTVQKIQYMISQAVGTVYLDSISVVSESDMALLPTAISQVRSMESFKVYPNPAVNKLNIDLSIANSSVAIYNSVGVKMEEVTVSGTHHVFDVSRYTKGLYFVKANGAVVKFIK